MKEGKKMGGFVFLEANLPFPFPPPFIFLVPGRCKGLFPWMSREIIFFFLSILSLSSCWDSSEIFIIRKISEIYCCWCFSITLIFESSK